MNNITVHEIGSNSASARLYGFGINSDQLLFCHKDWLTSYILPILYNGGSVLVVGEASRTGNKSLNKRLSQRRAQNVVTHLRLGILQTGINVNFGIQLGDEKTSSLGAGEFLAELAGRADGTENGFYRAATIVASVAPLKQRILQRKPSRAFIKRVVERDWTTIKSSSGGGNPYKSGEAGATIGRLARNIYLSKTRGGSDTRKYLMTPDNYLVNKITYESHIHEIKSAGLVTRRFSDTYTYEWGVPKKMVTVHEITSGNGITEKVNNTHAVSRGSIWKHVMTPYVP